MSIGAPLFVPSTQDFTQNLGNLPDLNDAIRSTFQLLTFEVLTKQIYPGGILRETTNPVSFYGSLAPHIPTPLDIAAHGQRAWSMKDCCADRTIQLTNDSVVIYLGVQYRVQGYSDYTPYGYQGFQLILDYTGQGPVIDIPNVLTTQGGDTILTQDGQTIDLVSPPVITTEGGVPIQTQDGYDINT